MVHRNENGLRDTGRLVLVLLLIAGVFAVYGESFGHRFLYNWDDSKYILGNPAVRGISLDHLRTAFSSFVIGNYAPVQIVSYMIDYDLWGMNPAGFIGTNLMLHALNGGLFFLLLAMLGMERSVAFGAAFIFLFHPVQVESVAWISQRKTLLAMFFFLLSFISYYRYREKGSMGLYLASLAFCIIGLLSKSVGVILPAVLLLFDLCYPAPSGRVRLQDKIPFLVVCLVAAGLTLVSQLPGGSAPGGIRDYPGGSLLATFFTMAPVLAGYLRDCFLPLDLSPYYVTPIRSAPDIAVVLSSLLLLLLAAGGIVLYRRDRRLFFWYAFFFVGLLPVVQIVPLITLKNDRYLYFPLLGFAPCLMLAVGAAVRRLPRGRGMAWVMVAVLLCTLPLLTFRQARIWKDPITLWSHAVRVDPANQVGWRMLLLAYTREGNSTAALAALERLKRLQEEHGPVRGWE